MFFALCDDFGRPLNALLLNPVFLCLLDGLTLRLLFSNFPIFRFPDFPIFRFSAFPLFRFSQ